MDEKLSTDSAQSGRISWQAPQLTEIDIEGATLVVAGSGPDGGGSSSHS